jgi:NAD(P)-dependent dehydrogenase (short-subunit alcohol dehydrogenase family)
MMMDIDPKTPLKGRIALVTGASRGIGQAAALEYAKAGAHVIALARTVGGLEELDDAIKAIGGSATLVPVDLTDFDALDRLGLSIYERWGKLDILLGNGAILGPITPVNHIEPKEFDKVMATNVTANYRLIRSMDPLLRASDAGRAVFLSSGASWGGYAYWGLYGASKAALDAMVRSWAAEVANITPIRVTIVDPGRVRTKMRATAAPGEDPMSLPPPEALAPFLVSLSTPAWNETGRVFSFPHKHMFDFRPPG